MEPHAPIRLTVDSSHTQRQAGWGKREQKGRKKQWGRDKSGWQITVALDGLQKDVDTCAGMYVCISFWLRINCLTLLELIPIKSLQRAAVCLTTLLICWHLFSRMRKNSWQKVFQERSKGDSPELLKHIALGSAADCQTCLQLYLQDAWAVTAKATAHKKHVWDKRIYLSGWKKARLLQYGACNKHQSSALCTFSWSQLGQVIAKDWKSIVAHCEAWAAIF